MEKLLLILGVFLLSFFLLSAYIVAMDYLCVNEAPC